MHHGDVLLLKAHEVRALLTGRELEIIGVVREAYEIHAQKATCVPESTFLRFPGDSLNRIIALPAFLGGDYGVAGIKWVSSFPGNLSLGLERASAVVILNCPKTGLPKAVLEGSIISAKRTAGSAALAALSLQKRPSPTVGLVGCGIINLEIGRFLVAMWPDISRFLVFDTDPNRSHRFSSAWQNEYGRIGVEIAEDIGQVLKTASVICLATTALEPHISDLSGCEPGSTVLHISLRDLSAAAILASDNIVDDIDHVCRAQTSVYLAEQQVGHRDFIRCTLPDLLAGTADPKQDENSVSVFSPFGLGILDLAVSSFVYNLAIAKGVGTVIPSFCPGQAGNTGKRNATAGKPGFNDL